MNTNGPTLKIRVSLTGNFFGQSCHDVADRLVSGEAVTVVDAEWGRSHADWIATGRGWSGPPRLTANERGYVDACIDLAGGGVAAKLCAIIERITHGGVE